MKISLRYLLLDPTGNVTILCLTPVPEDIQPAAAYRLSQLEPSAEQTGFVSGLSPDLVRMRMAGGEFCGNAAMSAASVCAMKAGLQEADIPVSFAGAGVTVPVRVSAGAGGSWDGRVTMPEPEDIRIVGLPGGMTLPAVFFPGIVHVIAEEDIGRAESEKLCREWCRYLGADALGIMRYDRDGGSLTPLVYVENANTLFWENSCASGTAALGYWLNREHGPISNVSVREPGGALEIRESGGRILLSGKVRVLRGREAEIKI